MKKLIIILVCALLVSFTGVEILQAQQWRYCILRKPIWKAPPTCFEFYLADTFRTDKGRMAGLTTGGSGLNLLNVPLCVVTPLAARQGWTVDIRLGGPYRTYRDASTALSDLSIYGGNLYGCPSGR
jgi:hypothetical protein